MMRLIKLTFLVVALALLTMSVYASSKSNADNGISAHGWLHVQGVQLMDENDKPMVLRGMSSHGLAWYPTFSNYRALVSTRDRGANLFRAAMYSDSIHTGYTQDEKNKKYNSDMLYSAVENALGADMYVIADWHVLMDGDPLTHVDEAIEFFDELSAQYANEPGILYEICNEPNGDVTWQDIKNYANKVIPIIRENAPNAVIIVGTPNYSIDLESVIGSPLSYKNILYSYHYYTGHSDIQYNETLDAARKAGLPVFVTEWGINIDKSTGKLGTARAQQFLAYLKKEKISWANWSLSNKNEVHAAIKPGVKKISGWSNDDLTESGKIVFKAFSD